MKKKLIIVLLFLFIFVMLAIIRNYNKSYGYDNNDEVVSDDYILSPLWEEYKSLSEEEKSRWEVIPEKYIIEFKAGNKSKKSRAMSSEDLSLPTSYDLRNVDGVSYVTPVKDQGSLGLCWAFSTVSTLESAILKEGLRTADDPAIFAERQLDYALAIPTNHKTELNSYVQTITEGYNPYHYNRQLGGGGSWSGKYLAMGISVASQDGIWGNSYNTVLETKDLKDVFNMSTTDYVVTDYRDLGYITNNSTDEDKYQWREKVKQLVMDYGAVDIDTLGPMRLYSYACFVDSTKTDDNISLLNWTDDCKSGSKYAYSGSHEMTIIGWDDNYVQSYCALPEVGNTNTNYDQQTCEENNGVYRTVTGAWILKNSWGSFNSYVHLAYDSNYFTAAHAISKVKIKDFDNTYNSIGPKTMQKIQKSTYLNPGYEYTFSYIATYYKPKNIENLKRISFSAVYKGTPYVAKVYLVNSFSGEDIFIGETTINDYSGRYSVDATESYPLYGSYFTVKIVHDQIETEISDIYAFTANFSGNNTHNITIIDSFSTSNNIYSYKVSTRTNNAENATKLTFNISDQSGNVQSLLEGNDFGYIVANADTTTLKSEYDLSMGLYFIMTYADNVLIGTDAFSINSNLSGQGTQASPYLIQSINDFDYMFTSNYGDKYFKLAIDLDLSEYDNFTSINSENFNYMFSGVLDGDNHTISNLKQNSDNAGFFASISGTIKNLRFKNVDITANTYGGILAAEAYYANISNISVEGTVTANTNQAYIGGIVGMANNTTIEKSYNKATINGGISGSFVGDLQEYSSILNSFNLGEFVNPTATLSSFAGNVEANHNTLAYLIDYNGKEHSNCNEVLNQSYNSDELIINNVYYYKNGTCKYLGNDLDYDEIRDIENYTNFDNTIWHIEDNLLPTLINNHVILTYSFDIERPSNVVVNQTYSLNYVMNPNIITYSNIEINSNDITKADYINDKITTYKSGLVTFTISALDGSRTKKSFDIYVFDEKSYIEINNESFITFKTKNDLSNQAQNEGITIEASTTIGTGATVTYKLNNEVISTFKVIIKGDLNGDGNNNSLDLSAMLNHISGKKGLKNEYLNAAQLNSDINVNSLDLAYLLNKIAGKEGY